MPEKSASDIIMEYLERSSRPFMALRRLMTLMNADTKRKLGLWHVTNMTTAKKILEPQIKDRFVFVQKNTTFYVLIPCTPEDLILAELSKKTGKSPSIIARSMPFTKKECAMLINELAQKNSLRIELNNNLEPRLFLTDASEEKVNNLIPASVSESEYTFKRFREAFDSLNNGRIFVKISDIRKTLGWPREEFDRVLKDLRDHGVIQLHVGDTSLMTPEEVRDSFVDENNFRMGTATWHVR